LHFRAFTSFFLSFLTLFLVQEFSVNGVEIPIPFTQNPDSLASSQDTSKVESPLNDPIIYNANDSLMYSIDGKKAFLYGDAVATYQNMELKAAFIEFDMETNNVYARGLPDSSGIIVGKPEFKEGEQLFRMDEITYNFNTRRAKITGVITEEAGGYLHSKVTKKMENDNINIAGGKFTTCDLDHPHFYVAITKAKIIPGEKLITGPAYLVIQDVPFPLVIPFGYFPTTKGRSSGIILPQYGEENNRGFFLRDAGFYFGFSDYVDLKATGSVFSKGSWTLNTQSTYRKRYKYSGNITYQLAQTVLSEEGLADYSKDRTYRIGWNHNQDPKANPNSTFRASVNIASPSHRKYQSESVNSYLAGTMQSSISYNKTWPGTPFSMTSTLSHSQNNRDSIVTLGIPKVSFNMSRISPFKRKSGIGAPKWYEKVGLSYSVNFDNSVTARTDSIFTRSAFNNLKNGVKHSIPISTSFNILKFITISPSVSYSEYWYTKTIEKSWDTLTNKVVIDTIPGFKRAWQYSTGASMSTKLYGMYSFGTNSFVQAIRHVVTPSVSLGYSPDFGDTKYGYWKEVQVNASGKTQPYSIFEQSLYGGPGRGKSGTVNFSLGNNLEMKVLSLRDTTVAVKKVKLLESVNLTSSYNMLADSMNWTPVSLSARTNLFEKININFSSIFNPYAIDSVGKTLSSYNYEKTGKPFRFTAARVGVGISLKSTSKKKNGKDNSGSMGISQGSLPGMNDGSQQVDMFGESLGTYYGQMDYVDFDVPWNLRLDYTFSYAKPGLEKQITQAITFSGDLSLSPKWKIGFYSGYDFKNMKLTTTSINFYRDLHCWEMRLTVIPIGYLKSFSFQLNVKPGVLQDLKITKRQGHLDNQ